MLPTSVCFYPWREQPSGSLPFSTLHLVSMFGPWKWWLCSRVGLCLSFSLLILEWGGEWCSKHVLLVPTWLVPSCWILSFPRVRSTFFICVFLLGRALCLVYKVVSRTLMDLRFDTTCKLSSEPAAVSWMPAGDTRLGQRRGPLLTAIAIAGYHHF